MGLPSVKEDHLVVRTVLAVHRDDDAERDIRQHPDGLSVVLPASAGPLMVLLGPLAAR